METLGDKNLQKTSKNLQPKFICELCDYSTVNKYNFTLHISTTKHKKETECDKKRQKLEKTCNQNSKSL